MLIFRDEYLLMSIDIVDFAGDEAYQGQVFMRSCDGHNITLTHIKSYVPSTGYVNIIFPPKHSN